MGDDGDEISLNSVNHFQLLHGDGAAHAARSVVYLGSAARLEAVPSRIIEPVSGF